MKYDFKKAEKDFYTLKQTPTIIEIPTMHYISVKGQGNPNEENGDFSQSIAILYNIIYTLKMSPKHGYTMNDFFDFVAPPLEGFWWMQEETIDYTSKEKFFWIVLLRLPEFIKEEDVKWAIEFATKKKKKDFSKVTFTQYTEGLCVQCLHVRSYDDEPLTTKKMDELLAQTGYEKDIKATRFHHEIYLSNAKKAEANKMKTILRCPIKKKEENK